MQPTIEHEIELSRAAGVSHPENLPYLLLPEQPNRHGVLLVHGFGATPREMRPLADRLVQKNFTVFAVCLPGHGTTPEDLATRTAEEWLATTERGYRLLQQRQLSVSAVGLSTGCLLLLQLAERQSIEKLVLLSPYLRLQHPLVPLAGLLSAFISFHHRQIEPAEQPFYYQRRPLKGIVQLNRLRKKTQKILSQITTPTLILASTGDRTVQPGTAEQLFAELGSKLKTFHCYGDKVPHVLTAAENPCQADVLARSCAFLEPALQPPAGTEPRPPAEKTLPTA